MMLTRGTDGLWEQGDFQTALRKAKEAGKKERLLCRTREQAGLVNSQLYMK